MGFQTLLGQKNQSKMPSTPSSLNFWLPPKHFKIAFFYRKIFVKCTTPAKVKFLYLFASGARLAILESILKTSLVYFALSLHAFCKFLVSKEKKR